MKGQQFVSVVVEAVEADAEGWPPRDAKGFVAWVEAKVALVPPEHRDMAEINFFVGDECCAGLEISYRRPLMADEAAALEGAERQQAAERGAAIRQQELRALARLKAKYEI